MDKNSENWGEIKEIEVINPFHITPLLRMNPTTPSAYDGVRFDVFLDDEIGTEKIVFRGSTEDFRDTDLYKEYLLSEKQQVITKRHI